jgi:succinate dehydrogenase / fumarate reductase, cytochrome b subunit
MSKVLFSSITKKFTMALAGLFLLTFLPLHLIINLMLLRSVPGPFNTAAHFMATFPLIKIMEVVLFGAILIHITYGIWLQIKNWLSRPVGYVSGNKSEVSFFSRFMIWTGAIILTFLILHWFNFYFIKLGIVKGNADDFYSVAHSLFKTPAYDFIYLTCFALLGFHLFHAFYSAFQTLGLNHRLWNPVVKPIALIYAIAIPAGFAFISISLWLFR